MKNHKFKEKNYYIGIHKGIIFEDCGVEKYDCKYKKDWLHIKQI